MTCQHLMEACEAKSENKALNPTLGFLTIPTGPLTAVDKSSLSFPVTYLLHITYIQFHIFSYISVPV